MVAEFTITGISITVQGIEQNSSLTTNDFTNPVTYLVTAENGTSLEYTVYVLYTVTRAQLDTIISNDEDVTSLDTSSITDMSDLFLNNRTFNQDISRWDVGNVTNMNNMFRTASAFNQDISAWNVSKVTGMHYMFYEASAFNQDISEWDVSEVTQMSGMFAYASSFNQDISSWKEHVAENISHGFFSYGCPLYRAWHPYTSWD